MTTPSETQEDFARRLLASATRAATTPDERVEAAVALFEQTFDVLASVVGADGVEAIFKRSVRLTQRKFPCLEVVQGQRMDPRLCLRACQRDDDGSHATSVAIALYARFVASIVTLIGEGLTVRIIRTAWPDTAETDTRAKENDG